MYDTIIIGGGPAGLTAGIYAARFGLKAVIFDCGSPIAQISEASSVENYPGFNPFVYSVDVFIPFVKLNQENHWLPAAAKPYGGYFRLYLWIHIALGWIFSTLAVAALAGLVRKE